MQPPMISHANLIKECWKPDGANGGSWVRSGDPSRNWGYGLSYGNPIYHPLNGGRIFIIIGDHRSGNQGLIHRTDFCLIWYDSDIVFPFSYAVIGGLADQKTESGMQRLHMIHITIHCKQLPLQYLRF